MSARRKRIGQRQAGDESTMRVVFTRETPQSPSSQIDRSGRSGVALREACNIAVLQFGAPADGGQQCPQRDPPLRQKCFLQNGAYFGLDAATPQSCPHTQGAMHLVR